MTHTDPNITGGEQREASREEWHIAGEELVTTVKKLFHEGTVRRIIIKHKRQTALEIPLTVGVVGMLLAPWLAAVGAMGALLTQCTVEVVRTERPGDPPVVQGEGGMIHVS
jgi:hypothetical protein